MPLQNLHIEASQVEHSYMLNLHFRKQFKMKYMNKLFTPCNSCDLQQHLVRKTKKQTKPHQNKTPTSEYFIMKITQEKALLPGRRSWQTIKHSGEGGDRPLRAGHLDRQCKERLHVDSCDQIFKSEVKSQGCDAGQSTWQACLRALVSCPGSQRKREIGDFSVAEKGTKYFHRKGFSPKISASF